MTKERVKIMKCITSAANLTGVI